MTRWGTRTCLHSVFPSLSNTLNNPSTCGSCKLLQQRTPTPGTPGGNVSLPAFPASPASPALGLEPGGERAGPQQDLGKNVSHWAGAPGPAAGVMCRAQAHKGHRSPVTGWLSLWGPRPTAVQGGHGEAGLKKPGWRPVWITLHRICEHPYPCGLGSVHASHTCESLVCGLPSVSSVTSHTIPTL